MSSFRRLGEVLAMVEPSDLAIALYIILIFAVFVSGLFLGAKFSPFSPSRHNARKEPKPWHARLATAEGKPRHDGKNGSTNLLAVVIALVVVSGVIAVDQFKGPLFRTCSTESTAAQPNTQQSRDVAVRRPLPMDVQGDEDE